MALMTELVETEPSSFKEVVEKPIWVDAMLEEYDSIVKKCFGSLPRPTDKSVMGSRLIFKVK